MRYPGERDRPLDRGLTGHPVVPGRRLLREHVMTDDRDRRGAWIEQLARGQPSGDADVETVGSRASGKARPQQWAVAEVRGETPELRVGAQRDLGGRACDEVVGPVLEDLAATMEPLVRADV